jgi:hypothetical protein
VAVSRRHARVHVVHQRRRFRTEAGLEFLTAKHSTAKNINVKTDGATYIAIHTFDDEVFQILSEMTDSSAYWFPIFEYKQVR